MKLKNIQGYIDSSAASLALLLAVIFIFIIRKPVLLIHPRFFAEEGKYFFKYAYEHPWYEVISHAHPNIGYLSLFDNIVTMMASLVPIEYAAFVTTYSAFAAQLVPFIIVILGKSSYWHPIQKKIPVIATMLFIGCSSEIWLTSLNSKFYLVLAAFLILIEDTETSRIKQIVYTSVLIISALSSPVACFLTPFFLLKAWKHKGNKDISYALILSIICLIHLLVMFNLPAGEGSLANRISNASFIKTVKILLIYHVLGLLVGVETAFRLYSARAIYDSYFLVLFLVLCFILVYYIKSPIKIFDKIIFLGSFFTVTILSILTSLQANYNSRYAYASSVILVMGFLQAYFSYKENNQVKSEYVGRKFLVFIIFIGILNYFIFYTSYSSAWPQLDKEIALWKQDKTRSIALHPPGWYMDLSEPD